MSTTIDITGPSIKWWLEELRAIGFEIEEFSSEGGEFGFARLRCEGYTCGQLTRAVGDFSAPTLSLNTGWLNWDIVKQVIQGAARVAA